MALFGWGKMGLYSGVIATSPQRFGKLSISTPTSSYFILQVSYLNHHSDNP